MPPFRDTEARRRAVSRSYKDLTKHYVRVEGWLPVFERYARERRGLVRYLTLCAKAAIDVRYFRLKGVLAHDPEQNAYPSLTFVERDSQDFAAIAESLGTTRLGIRGDLEQVLLLPETCPDQFRALRETFPYDIINLDFQGQVVREHDPPYSSTIRAIERIIDLQHRAGARSWHMFLTFRACPQTSNGEANDELRGMMERNLEEPAARTAYGSRPEPGRMIEVQFYEFLRVGVAKFLASRAADLGYQMDLEHSYFYERPPRGGLHYRIVKLIARFNTIRRARSLPNPHAMMAAYQASVPAIFRSEGIDVGARLQNPAEEERIRNELRPVLEELEREGIQE
jgi:hypothetical protein